MLRLRSFALFFGICACLFYGLGLFADTTSEIPKVKEENKMFLILLKYKKPLEEVRKIITPHIDFLKKHYASSELILQVPAIPGMGE